MGRWIQAKWRVHHFDERAFPEVAMAALEAFPPTGSVTYSDVIQAWVFDGDLPPNVSSRTFGEPGVTVHAAERFYIEVLCWMDGTTSIHQHQFSGAFHVLEGSSIHSTYRFEERQSIDSQMALGRLDFVASELLKRGDRRAIHAGPQLIHALFHLDRPSVSVVVRTQREAGRLPQWDYVRPYLAVDPFHAEADRRRRLLQTLEVLSASDPAAHARFVDRVVFEGDLSLVYAALEHSLAAVTEPPFRLDETRLAEIHRAVRVRFGRTGDELIASCHQYRLTWGLARRRLELHDRELRLFLALLMNVPTRRALLGLIEGHLGGDPLVHVQRWLRQLVRSDGPGAVELLELSIDLEEPYTEVPLAQFLQRVLDAMLAGHRGEALRRALTTASPPANIEPLLDCVSQLEARLLDSSLRPLFADD